jgi:hypothetical protein
LARWEPRSLGSGDDVLGAITACGATHVRAVGYDKDGIGNCREPLIAYDQGD